MNRVTRLAALAGMIGPVLFGSVLLVLPVVEYDFMRTRGWGPLSVATVVWPSGLALGPYGYVMTAAFLVNGLLVVVFALGLGQTLPGTTASRAAATLLLLAGFAMLGLAFTTDASIRRTPATWHGIIHDLSFAGVGLTLFPSMLAFGWGISPIFGLARAEHVYLADGSAGSSNLCAKRGSVLRVSRGSARVDRESCVETEKDGGPVPEQAQLP